MYTYKKDSHTPVCPPDEAGRILAVTNRSLCIRPFPEQLKRVCSISPKAIILREKDLSEADYLTLAENCLTICRSYNVPLILHTHVRAARTLGCSAIHLPLPVLEGSQDKLDGFTDIGVSIHSVEDARRAEALGATYLTAGHIYSTDCKKGLPPRGLDFLQEVCRSVSIPVYAIGGIQIGTGQIRQVMECGAAGGCIMSGMMQL